MTSLVKLAKAIRNNWKKSVFALVAFGYGVKYINDRHETNKLMHIYCEKAVVYGKQALSNNALPRTVTIILNPSANKRKAFKNFEKYCAPILNLAGVCVNILQTESEGHAKTIMNNLTSTDAIVVAGGDGTLSEVITGLLRNTEEKNLLPIGILPLGRTNTLAKFLFPADSYLEDVKCMADASLAVVENITKPVDIMRIEVLSDDSEHETGKPVYAVIGIEWGAFRDAQVKKDSYWYFGTFRKYATYVFNGYKDNLNWNCEALVKYSLPCDGCLNCAIASKSLENKRWYNRFITNKSNSSEVKTINNECKEIYQENVLTSDFGVLTTNVTPHSITEDSTPKLHLNVGPTDIDYIDFIQEGWKSEEGQFRKVKNSIKARQIEIHPTVTSDEESQESWFSIDKENFEVKPIKVTLLPKLINVFCKKNNILVEE